MDERMDAQIKICEFTVIVIDLMKLLEKLNNYYLFLILLK